MFAWGGESVDVSSDEITLSDLNFLQVPKF